MFLQRLDFIEDTVEIHSGDFIFNMDIEALYDSLDREHVERALREAIEKCRPDWSEELVEWLIYSVKLFLDAAVGKFG